MKNCKNYNERLVKRGEIFISKEVIENWNKELAEMNRGKQGRPYRYPESLMRIAAYAMFYFRLPYRQTEGLLRSYGNLPHVPDYTSIHRRVCKMASKLDNAYNRRIAKSKSGSIIIAIDSTGIKVSNNGEWMRKKWGKDKNKKHKGFLKIHVASDVQTGEVLADSVTDERSPDCKNFKGLVCDASDIAAKRGSHILRVLADGAYDSRDIFSFLEEKGIEPAIRVHKNSVPAANKDCPARKKAVEAQLFNGDDSYNTWRHSVSYGKRWTVESVFSVLKRMFGESVRSRNKKNMVTEMLLKMELYNKFIADAMTM